MRKVAIVKLKQIQIESASTARLKFSSRAYGRTLSAAKCQRLWKRAYALHHFRSVMLEAEAFSEKSNSQYYFSR